MPPAPSSPSWPACRSRRCCSSGCRTNREADDLKSGPEIIYERASKSLAQQDYNNAIRLYEALNARYPFANEARQARLDLIYAYYKGRETESALDAADTFIRENPTHPRVDYAWYIKGLVDFERTPNVLERCLQGGPERAPAADRAQGLRGVPQGRRGLSRRASTRTTRAAA